MVFSSANLTIDVFGAAVLLVLIVCQLVSTDRGSRLNKIFLLVLCIHAAILVLDIVGALYSGAPGGFTHGIMWGAHFFSYFLAPLDVVALLAYVAECISLDKGARRRVFGIALSVTALNHVLLVVSQFNGMFYSIGQNNVSTEGPLFFVPRLFLFLLFFSVFVVVVLYRKKLGRANTLTFMIYTVVLGVAFVVNFIYPTLRLIYAAMVLALLIIFVNVHIQRERKLKERELALTESRSALMLSQIQPHFLYNTLASINDLCRDNPEAKKAIITFSKYLRANMDSLSKKRLIDVEEELEHTRQYLWLEELRFDERLTVVYDIQATGFLLPVLTIQPMVENAVLHGITEKRAGGTVTILSEKTAEGHRVTITDDGVGFEPAAVLPGEMGHMGIENVRARLEALCGGTLTVESAPDEGTTVVIEIPA